MEWLRMKQGKFTETLHTGKPYRHMNLGARLTLSNTVSLRGCWCEALQEQASLSGFLMALEGWMGPSLRCQGAEPTARSASICFPWEGARNPRNEWCLVKHCLWQLVWCYHPDLRHERRQEGGKLQEDLGWDAEAFPAFEWVIGYPGESQGAEYPVVI